MHCSTAKCYISDRDSYPCPPGHLSYTLKQLSHLPTLCVTITYLIMLVKCQIDLLLSDVFYSRKPIYQISNFFRRILFCREQKSTHKMYCSLERSTIRLVTDSVYSLWPHGTASLGDQAPGTMTRYHTQSPVSLSWANLPHHSNAELKARSYIYIFYIIGLTLFGLEPNTFHIGSQPALIS